MTVAIVSSVFGNYDTSSAPPTQDIDCEWVLVTDRMPEIRGDDPWPWKVIEEPRPTLSPRLAAKVAKCRPDHYTDAEVTIWVDGHIRVTSPMFARWATAPLERADLAQLRHPNRRSLLEEAALSATLPKYAGQPVAAQAAHYLQRGYPDGWGLWAAGIIARRTSPAVRAFGDAWLAEQVRWTLQDQLSEPPLLYWSDLEIADLDGPLLGHPLFSLTQHADGTL